MREGNKIGRLDEYVIEQLAKKCTAETEININKNYASEELQQSLAYLEERIALQSAHE